MQVWDFTTHLNALAQSEAAVNQGGSSVFNQAPLVKFGGHKDEGYAIDWSPRVTGRLVSGTVEYSFYMLNLFRTSQVSLILSA